MTGDKIVNAILADAILNVHRDHKREGEASVWGQTRFLSGFGRRSA